MPKSECPLFFLEGPQHAEYQCDQCEINELEDLYDAVTSRVFHLESVMSRAAEMLELAMEGDSAPDDAAKMLREALPTPTQRSE